jgi:hypothetical protein
MHKTKLVVILQTFSKKEFLLFEKWMKSSFFNSNKNQAALLKCIAPYHPEFKSEKINKAAISAMLFPSSEYNDARMRNLISDVQEKAEDFMIWSNFLNDKAAQKQILIEELNMRKLNSLFESKLKETRKAIDNSEKELYSPMLGHYLADQEEFRHHYNENFGRFYKVPKKFDIHKMIRSSTNLYLTQVLYYYHQLLYDRKILEKNDSAIENFKKLGEALYSETQQDNILAFIYLKILGLDSGTSSYFEIKSELKKKEFNSQPYLAQQNILSILSNFCTKKHLNGIPGFLDEILYLGAISLKKKFCFLGQHISHVFFFNYVCTFIEADKIDEAKKFAAEYRHAIQPDMKESTFHFAMANIFLYEKKFQDALAALREVKNDTPTRALSIKNLLLKIYFEKNDTDQVPFVIDAIRHFLRSETDFSEHQIAGGKKFLHYYNLLAKIKINDSRTTRKDLPGIIGEMKQPGPLTNRFWLIKMAEEMHKAKKK